MNVRADLGTYPESVENRHRNPLKLFSSRFVEVGDPSARLSGRMQSRDHLVRGG